MAEEHQHQKSHEHEPTVGTDGAVESKDRGLFDFLGKKEEEKPQHHQDQDQVIATEFERVHVSEPKVEEEYKVHVSEPKVEEHKGEEEEKKPGLLGKLHRSNSSSSSSSDEEEGDDEETKKKREKKGLKEKLKEKISGDKEEKHEETTVPVEKVDEVPHHQEQAHPEENKGFLDKIKDKLPGQHKKPEDQAAASPPPTPATHQAEHTTTEGHNIHDEGEAKEKKGILEKLKEKIPGYHPKTEEEKEKEKEKEKESTAH